MSFALSDSHASNIGISLSVAILFVALTVNVSNHS